MTVIKRRLLLIGMHYYFERSIFYALTVALNYEQIKSHPEKTSKIKLFIDQYSWKEVDFPSHSKD